MTNLIRLPESQEVGDGELHDDIDAVADLVQSQEDRQQARRSVRQAESFECTCSHEWWTFLT